MVTGGPGGQGTAKGRGRGGKRRRTTSAARDAKPKGRPQRLAHLVPGTSQHARLARTAGEGALPHDLGRMVRGEAAGRLDRDLSGLPDPQPGPAPPARTTLL